MKETTVRLRGRRVHRRGRYGWYIGSGILILLIAAMSAGLFRKEQADGVPYVSRTTDNPPAIAMDGERRQVRQDAADSDIPWYLTLVNRWNPIPENYEVNLVEVEGGQLVDERIYEPLMEMLEAAKEANWNQLPLVVSGYRTQKKQQSLYEDKIAKYRRQGYSEDLARETAEQWVAVPGYSEHQLGFAVDLNGANYDFYLWLQENSYKYGFIFRYPGNKTEITNTAEEVWHYRYVGVEAAKEIYEQGLCLEEYLENLDGETIAWEDEEVW